MKRQCTDIDCVDEVKRIRASIRWAEKTTAAISDGETELWESYKADTEDLRKDRIKSIKTSIKMNKMLIRTNKTLIEKIREIEDLKHSMTEMKYSLVRNGVSVDNL
jgi:hypothetical protein